MSTHSVYAATSENVPLDVRPAKIQIACAFSQYKSESSLCTFWIAKDAKFLNADNEEIGETVRMHRLICVFCCAQMSEGTFSDLAIHVFTEK